MIDLGPHAAAMLGWSATIDTMSDPNVQLLISCLEWSPFYKGWLNVTQPYMKKFNCKNE